MKNFPNSRPNSYPRTIEIDTEKLATALFIRQKELKISQREVSRRLGERSANPIARIKYGQKPSSDLFIRILIWLGTTDISPYVKDIE